MLLIKTRLFGSLRLLRVLSLNRKQKESIGLLSIGTFLEYFDLMLYVHMAVLLNDLFFPKTNTHMAVVLQGFAFCSSFVFRPLAAILFGYIGDHIGRTSVLIITTTIMAISCFIIAILPTYEEIGILASIIMLGSRILQSFAVTGEIVAAELYLTEVLKPPLSYIIVSLVNGMCTVGEIFALLMVTLVFKLNVNWRVLFFLASMIAFVGTSARSRLKETVDFADMKRRVKKAVEDSNEDGLGKVAKLLKKTNNRTWAEKVNKKTILAYFFINSGGPLCFYIIFIYGSSILKNTFKYSVEQIIFYNLKLTICSLLCGISLMILCKYVYPLILIRIRAMVFLFLTPFISVFLPSTTNFNLFCFMQILLIIFFLGTIPAIPIFYLHLPLFKRFTYSSLIHSLSRAIMYLITSTGLVYLVNFFNKIGLLLVMLPIALGYLWAAQYFQKHSKLQSAI